MTQAPPPATPPPATPPPAQQPPPPAITPAPQTPGAQPEKKGEIKTDVQVEFRRDLKFFDATMIGIGAMIGAGIFVLIGTAAGKAGPAAILAFIFNGIIAMFTAMSYAELGATIPEAGGGYSYVRRAIKEPFGFISGWMLWFAYVVACALYALGFGSFLLEAWNNITDPSMHIPEAHFWIYQKILAVVIACIFISINYIGAETTGKTENVMTITKIIILFIFAGLGFYAMSQNPDLSNHYTPFFGSELGFTGMFVAMGLTFIAFEGYDLISTVGEEVQDPKKTIPKAIGWSLLIPVIIYVLIITVTLGLMHYKELGALEHPEVALVNLAIGISPYAGYLLIIGGLLSTMSALNATVLSSSRVSFAMGREGHLPKGFSRIHKKRHTPYVAVISSGFIIIVMMIALPIEQVAASASLMFLLTFILVNISVIILRKKEPDLERGWKIPLFPIPPIIGILANVGLAMFMFNYIDYRGASMIAVLWIVIGLIGFWFAGGREEILEEEFKDRIKPAEKVSKLKREFHVLLPIADPKHTGMVEFAAEIARAREGDLTMMKVVEVPKTLPVAAVGYRDVNEHIRSMESLEKMAKKWGAPGVRSRLMVSHIVGEAIVEEAKRYKANLVVLGWRGSSGRGWIFGSNIDHVVPNISCDVAVFQSEGLKKDIKDICVLHGHDWHVSHACELAAILAKKHKARLTILHICTESEINKEDAYRTEHLVEVIRDNGVEPKIKTAFHPNIIDGAVYESLDCDLLVLGASDTKAFRKVLFGDTPDRITARSKVPVLILKKVADEGEQKDVLPKSKQGPKPETKEEKKPVTNEEKKPETKEEKKGEEEKGDKVEEKKD
jgi:amino acid transporter/nucleotide-binding universal stress UspA family protein